MVMQRYTNEQSQREVSEKMKQTCKDNSELELEVESKEQRYDYLQLAWRRGRQRRAVKRKLTMLSVMFAPMCVVNFESDYCRKRSQ